MKELPGFRQKGGVCGGYPLFDYGYVSEEDIKAVVKVMRSQVLSPFLGGRHEPGPVVQEFENQFADYIGTAYAVSFNSCSSALHAAMLLLRLDLMCDYHGMVITTPYSFASSASCILQGAGTPKFVDIELDTFALDINKVKEVDPDTVIAVILTHLLGYPARDVIDIQKYCDVNDIVLIEDCAQALGAHIAGKKVGAFGDIACFSFGEGKQMTTLGEGGMCVTDDYEIFEELCKIRNHGECFKDSHILGYNWRLTEAQAAMGISQLERIDATNEIRARNANQLNYQLCEVSRYLDIPWDHPGRVYSMYDMWVNTASIDRDVLLREINYLTARHKYGQVCYAGYTKPLYRFPIFEEYCDNRLENTEWACKHSIWSPKIYPPYSLEDMDEIAGGIIAAINEVINNE
jgi:perosamine synthetase